jgi:Zn-dependent protease with chaperone function
MRFFPLMAVTSIVVAGACTTTTDPEPTSKSKPEQVVSRLSVEQATARLAPIKRRLEPIAERECKALTKGTNCDFAISVHKDRNAPPNAFQSYKSGRPHITFTAALISNARNDDELAFVMGHEAAHHIEGHIQQSTSNAIAGAVIVGVLATLAGAGSSGVDAAVDIGASVGGRSYSKKYELEADRLGTVITHKAGYNPVRGAEYFNRIPDPGDRFLGSHPPNQQRIETVRETAKKL